MDRAVETTFRVGVYTCTMRISEAQAKRGTADLMKCQWNPGMPKHMTPQMMDEYRAGRDSFLQEVSTMLGGKVVVVEV